MNRLAITAVMALASMSAYAHNPFLNLDGGNFCLPKYPSHVMRTSGLRIEYVTTAWTSLGYRPVPPPPLMVDTTDISFWRSRAITETVVDKGDFYPNVVMKEDGTWVYLVAPTGVMGYYWVR